MQTSSIKSSKLLKQSRGNVNATLSTARASVDDGTCGSDTVVRDGDGLAAKAARGVGRGQRDDEVRVRVGEAARAETSLIVGHVTGAGSALGDWGGSSEGRGGEGGDEGDGELHFDG